MEKFSGSALQQTIIDALTPGIVWIYFLVVVGVVGLLSVIIIWHWTKHGKGLARKLSAELVYAVITAAGMVALFIACSVLVAKL